MIPRSFHLLSASSSAAAISLTLGSFSPAPWKLPSSLSRTRVKRVNRPADTTSCIDLRIGQIRRIA